MKKEIKEKILETIYSAGYVPLTVAELYDFINPDGRYEDNDLYIALDEMEDCFDVVITDRYKVFPPEQFGIFKGTFSCVRGGYYGFVSTESERFFIPARFVMGAMHNDTVVIRKFDIHSRFSYKGNEAEIIAILKRASDKIIGTFKITMRSNVLKTAHVIPDGASSQHLVQISAKDFGNAEDGDKVLCQIYKYPNSENDTITGRVVQILGRADSLEANYKAILIENGIRDGFKPAVLQNAQEVSSEKLCIQGRTDLRNKTIFTIDGEDAKDLDDAISIDITDSGYILGVHIADVSHYVREKSPTDKEAMKRGTSVYFTDKVVPMLPKILSNGICSLNGGEDRYALSAFITLDRFGNILSTDIKNTIINSKVRGVYSELNDIIEKGNESEFYRKYSHILDDFNKMLELYGLLKAKSARKGALELEGEESKIILDEKGHPVDIIKRERGESEKLIEQFMLCANEGVANYLKDAHLPCVYRIHEPPDKEKISAFASFAKNLGVDVSSLRSKGEIKPKQLSAILESAHRVGCFGIVSSVLLRSLMKAKYSAIQKPHFGLATENYCHFTSPIRRYPDLSVHRIIKASIDGKIDETTIEAFEKFAIGSALSSSENELRAIYAEREIDDLYKCIYMSDRLGEEFDAVICSVTSFGFFARTENLCEGLVPLEFIGSEFQFDEKNYTLSHGKEIYRLGQTIKIKVEEADIVSKRVIFSISGKKAPAKKGLPDRPSRPKERTPRTRLNKNFKDSKKKNKSRKYYSKKKKR